MFSTAIYHAAFKPERVEYLPKLLSALNLREDDPLLHIVSDTAKSRTNHRFRRALEWSLDRDEDYAVFMDDDVVPCPDYWDHLEAAVGAKPYHLITTYPIAYDCGKLFAEGKAWGWTTDGLLGTNWLMPRKMLKDFCSWRLSAMKSSHILGDRDYPEDSQVILYALANKIQIWTTLPGLVHTSPDIGSTYDSIGTRPYQTTKLPFRPYTHNWQGEGFAGVAFENMHWHLITALDPEFVRRNKLASRAYRYERFYQKWLVDRFSIAATV
jgi:hypothetical protein